MPLQAPRDASTEAVDTSHKESVNLVLADPHRTFALHGNETKKRSTPPISERRFTIHTERRPTPLECVVTQWGKGYGPAITWAVLSLKRTKSSRWVQRIVCIFPCLFLLSILLWLELQSCHSRGGTSNLKGDRCKDFF